MSQNSERAPPAGFRGDRGTHMSGECCRMRKVKVGGNSFRRSRWFGRILSRECAWNSRRTPPTGPDLGQGRLGTCPGVPTKKGPHQMELCYPLPVPPPIILYHMSGHILRPSLTQGRIYGRADLAPLPKGPPPNGALLPPLEKMHSFPADVLQHEAKSRIGHVTK